MKSRLLVVLALAGGLLLAANPMLAHHSGHAYDRNRPVTFTGTVTSYEFTNPHSLIFVDVKDENGVVTRWVVQTASPSKLFRAGWNRNSLKPGDTVTVTGFPSKDGKKEMGLQKLTPPSGPVLTEGNE
jgi:DNA/RNA endonuclease YhcR with UshA esterase domain